MRVGHFVESTARTALTAGAAFFVLAFVAGVVLAPAYIAGIDTVLPINITWSAASTRAALAQLGWSPQGYNWLSFLEEVVQGLVYIGIALLLVTRRTPGWMIAFTGFVWATFAIGEMGTATLVRSFPWLSGFLAFNGTISWQLGFGLFFVFPDGRFVPRWTRWLLLACVAFNFLPIDTLSEVRIVAGMVLVFGALGGMVYRYLRVSDAIQRQQIKWVVFAVIVLLITLPVSILPFIWKEPFTEHGGISLLLTLIVKEVFRLTALILPISIAIAVLRYRLWDVDVLIRRTVVYAILTALLVIAYFGAVVVLQQLLRALTGQTNDLAIIISTLGVAALFAPLRRRIQDIIDRRLYRRRYDAEQVMSHFNQALREEVNLTTLQSSVLNVVQDTLQPARVSLWLNEPVERKNID